MYDNSYNFLDSQKPNDGCKQDSQEISTTDDSDLSGNSFTLSELHKSDQLLMNNYLN